MYVKSRAVGQTLGITNARHCLLKASMAAGLVCVDGPAEHVERTLLWKEAAELEPL